MRTLRIAVTVSFLVTGLAAQSSERFVVRPAPGDNAAFSPAIRAGGLVYVSSVMATDLKGDTKAQAKEIFEKLRNVLKQAGSSIDNIAIATVTLEQSEDLDDVDEVFRTEFKSDPPARTLVLGNMVRPGALLDIAVVAAPNGTPRRAILPAGWMKPPGPFSWAVLAGDTLYLSAMTPHNMKDGSYVRADITAQTITLMENAAQLLQAGGMSFDDTVSRRVNLRHRIDMGPVNAGFTPYWHVRDLKATGAVPGRPTSAAIGMTLIGPHDVEITFVAVKNSSPREIVIPPNPDGTPGQSGPTFSPGIKIGNRLWVSGNVPRQPNGPAGVTDQTTENLNLLGRILKAAGYDFKDVVNVEVWMTNVKNYDATNEVFRKFFPTDPPVRLRNVGVEYVDPNGSLGKNTMSEMAALAIK